MTGARLAFDRAKTKNNCWHINYIYIPVHHIIYIIVWCFICILSCENPNTKAIHCISSCGWLARQLQKSPIYRPIVCVCVRSHTLYSWMCVNGKRTVHECLSFTSGSTSSNLVLYIMCVILCSFRALSHWVGALQISIVIIIYHFSAALYTTDIHSVTLTVWL